MRLRAALALRPQDPELKRIVDRSRRRRAWRSDAAADELARRFAEDARASDPGRPGHAPAAPRGRWCCSIGGSCACTAMACRAPSPSAWCRCCTERGAEENKEFAVHYTPGTRGGRHPPGPRLPARRRRRLDVLEATDRSDEDLSEPWYGLYYDNRAEVVRFEGLRPGDVLEIQYLVDDVGSENQLADYFGDLAVHRRDHPQAALGLHAHRAGGAPDSTPTTALPRLERHDRRRDGDRIYRFAATRRAKVDAEPAMPGLAR